MTKHAGDPRSNDAGEIPFDMQENTGPVYQIPVTPPITPNDTGYVPYRGSEQHGQAFQNVAQDYTPFASGDMAHERYRDTTQTPRDIEPYKPIPVNIVDAPNLIQPTHVRFSSYNIVPAATGYPWVMVAQTEKLRKRLVIYVCGTAGGSGILRITSTRHSVEPTCMQIAFGANDTETVLDTVASSSIYVWAVSSTDPTVTVSVQAEYCDYDGVPLI